MKRLLPLFTVTLLAISGTALADEASLAGAEVLITTMNTKESYQKSIDAVLDAQIKQKPELERYRNVLNTFFSKYMNFETMKPEMVRMYADNFTAAELVEINAFYKTAVGKKTIQKLPELMNQSMAMSMGKVREHLPELQEMIEAENARTAEAPKKK